MEEKQKRVLPEEENPQHTRQNERVKMGTKIDPPL
jgi:hypothetical protein